jgi:hypothetical protein
MVFITPSALELNRIATFWNGDGKPFFHTRSILDAALRKRLPSGRVWSSIQSFRTVSRVIKAQSESV